MTIVLRARFCLMTGRVCPVFLSHRINLLRTAGEADDPRIERLGVLFQRFARVALRIDRDEERLHLGGVGTELLECRGDFVQCHRAGIGAEGVPEVNQQPFAAKCLVGHRRAVGCYEREWAADCYGRRGSPTTVGS